MGMKYYSVCAVFGVVGSFISSLFGGWDSALTTLLICMGVDFVTGLILGGVFHKSPKSANGALESKASWKGLCKKGITLLIVLISYRLEMLVDIPILREAVIISFIVSELLSIIENAGLMGVPIPKVITSAIALLKEKSEGDKE